MCAMKRHGRNACNYMIMYVGICNNVIILCVCNYMIMYVGYTYVII